MNLWPGEGIGWGWLLDKGPTLWAICGFGGAESQGDTGQGGLISLANEASESAVWGWAQHKQDGACLQTALERA